MILYVNGEPVNYTLLKGRIVDTSGASTYRLFADHGGNETAGKMALVEIRKDVLSWWKIKQKYNNELIPVDMREVSDYASKCSLLYNFSRENDSLDTAGTPIIHDITDSSRSAAANNATPVGTSATNRVADAPGTK